VDGIRIEFALQRFLASSGWTLLSRNLVGAQLAVPQPTSAQTSLEYWSSQSRPAGFPLENMAALVQRRFGERVEPGKVLPAGLVGSTGLSLARRDVLSGLPSPRGH
jgi:hypothetical protein